MYEKELLLNLVKNLTTILNYNKQFLDKANSLDNAIKNYYQTDENFSISDVIKNVEDMKNDINNLINNVNKEING